MILNLLKEHGELTIEQLSMITERSIGEVEKEITKLWAQRKVCMTKDGVCYIPPKTTFATWLLTAFLIFIIMWVFVGAIKVTF